MKLTKNFQLSEFTRSDTADKLGTKICASLEHTLNLTNLCIEVLQPQRDNFGPIYITSGLRNNLVNDKIQGAPDSQHLRGEAADIHIPNQKIGREYFLFMMENTRFDQLIWEQNNGTCWIHVSAKRLGGNRHQVIGLTY